MAGAKILVVDDEPDVRDVLRKKFAENGYDTNVLSAGGMSLVTAGQISRT